MSDVELPPDVEDDDGPGESASSSQWCSCKLRCFTKFTAESVGFHRSEQSADPNRMAHAFNKIKAMVEQRSSEDAKICWKIEATKVCRPFWEHYHGVGHGQVDHMVKLSKAGHPHLPERGPRLPREKRKGDIVDTWFLSLYQGSSEPIPVEGSADRLEEIGQDCLQHEVVNDIHHPLYGLSVAVGSGVDKQHLAPKRFLNEENLASLWGLYKNDTDVEEKVSRDTFTQAFNKRWKGLLNFKQYGQGTRCQLCADMDEERNHCTTKVERQELDLRKQRHFQRHDADRSMNVRSNQLSSDPSTYQLQNSSNKFMKLMVDGMDQAKFRCPRNLQAASAFSQATRPSLHLTGVLAFGLLEVYFILPPDTCKDSNMNATVISVTLDLCQRLVESWGPEHSLPRRAIIAADNTPRESKNQYFATFAASLVARRHFDSLEVQYMMTGHTKNELDQRFSAIATVLSKASVLETPQDFARWIQQHVRPMHGKELHVIVLDETWDFQAWYQKYNLQVSGLTATHLQPDANHVWRFQLRHSVESTAQVEVHNQNWKDIAQRDDDDVVLSLKQYLGKLGVFFWLASLNVIVYIFLFWATSGTCHLLLRPSLRSS